MTDSKTDSLGLSCLSGEMGVIARTFLLSGRTEIPFVGLFPQVHMVGAKYMIPLSHLLHLLVMRLL